MRRILRFDWDVVAGISAAGLAIILHLLHIVEVDVLLTIVLVLLAILLFRDLRREGHDEQVAESVQHMKANIHRVQLALDPPEAILIGPRRLRSESRKFCETASGEMLWFNVCFAMFQSQDVFDLMLRPAIENPRVGTVQFVSNPSERTLWEKNVLPKVKECSGHEKVKEPRWVELPETLSFILADTDPTGTTEALLSFWGEPFMGRTTGQQAPRYVFRIQGHSELVSQLVELERHHRSTMA